MRINAAKLSSTRLQAVLKVLNDGQPHSTWEISHRAKVMAVSACVAELREHGAKIVCNPRGVEGRTLWFYTMLKAPEATTNG